jgi:NAD+ synthase
VGRGAFVSHRQRRLSDDDSRSTCLSSRCELAEADPGWYLATAHGTPDVSTDQAEPIAAPLPAIEPKQAVEVITAFIRSQMEQTGFSRLVVGLSGGVDSAAVAYLAARAIGSDNLLAIRMPYRTSSEASETDALRVVDDLGCRTERIDITPMAEPMLELISGEDPAATKVRRGNVMARQRMIILYDRSAAFDALVVGTSNKTEALLGYGTLHGDMAAALQPIGDLYKTQLRAVARELGVPEEVVAKPPSADLWPGQTDEGELGRSYDSLDRVLFALVDRRWTIDRCVAAGLERSLVEWVAGRVARMEFKRQLPPVAKLSLRTPGIDHLYPRRRPGSAR